MKKAISIALTVMALSLFATPNTAQAGFWDHFKWHHKKQSQTNESTPTRSGNEATTSTQEGQGTMGGSQSGSSGSTYGGSSSGGYGGSSKSPQSSGPGAGSSGSNSGSSSGGSMGGTNSGGSTQY